MNKIRIFLTTALIDKSNVPLSHKDQRESLSIQNRIDEYIECFNIIKSFGYDFTIVETVLDKFPLFEEYTKVIYTNVNNFNYKNRGSNYVNAFKKVLNESDFRDDDIIVHITGRYPLVDNSFLLECENLNNSFDGCFSIDKYNQCYLFLYALRFKKLKDLLNSINVDYLENSNICLEQVFYGIIKDYKILFVEKLGIIGRQSSSNNELYGKILY
jgi:hypothetical protein